VTPLARLTRARAGLHVRRTVRARVVVLVACAATCADGEYAENIEMELENRQDQNNMLSCAVASTVAHCKLPWDISHVLVNSTYK
jgi:hypothetical protein